MNAREVVIVSGVRTAIGACGGSLKDGTFKQEIVPVPVSQSKGDPVLFDTDERPMETSLEKMGKLRPAFRRDGVVTAGNSSGINDGGSAVVLMSGEKATDLGLEPLVVAEAGVLSSGLLTLDLPSLFVIRTAGCVGTLRVVTGAAPVPLAAITQEDVHSQELPDVKDNVLHESTFHEDIHPVGRWKYRPLSWVAL